jgi:hypothetical protein
MRFQRYQPGDIIVPDTLRLRGREAWLEARGIGQDRPSQPKSVRSKFWSAIAAAMSVLRAHAIEGFASCAVGMYPELFHPLSGQVARRDLVENGRPDQPVDKQ